MRRFVQLALCCLLIHGSPLWALPDRALPGEHVPEPLKPWVGWVLDGTPGLTCPFFYNNYADKRCAWPARTQLRLDAAGGDFAAVWRVDEESWIQLPGDAEHWPQQVEAGGGRLAVIERSGVPVTRLAPGSYRIAGRFRWNGLPDALTLPSGAALIDLTVDGEAKTPALRDGRLWLKAAGGPGAGAGSADLHLDVQVFRKIIDDIPLQVLTRLVLDVAGKPRETVFGFAQLPEFQALNLQSELPARLQPDGRLTVQVRPGHWQIELLSRLARPASSLGFGAAAADDGVPRPASEIWVFESRPQLRTVTVEQVQAIDPSQSNLPDEWKFLPAYRVGEGQAMRFNVLGRGDENTEPNQLNLTRTLWLDFNGEGYTVNDRISGVLKKGWRLNALPDFRLGRVALDGVPQVITELEGSGGQGVEVRKGALAVDADSRINGSITAFSATGWEQDFQTVGAELNLPPGWHLLAAAGVDNIPDSWLARWTLLDLFMVLIAALAVAKLWRIGYGALALITLTLIWQEPGAPHFLWLNMLAAVALARVMPAGRPAKALRIYRAASWLALALLTLPFLVQQLRLAIYPQLEEPWAAVGEPAPEEAAAGGPAAQADLAEAPAPAAEKLEQMPAKAFSAMKLYRRQGNDPDQVSSADADFSRIDPDAKVQTGPGLPKWRWRTVQLSWNSSVAPEQKLRLWYLSPAASMLLNLIRVGLVFALILALADAAGKFGNLRMPPSLVGLALLLPLMAAAPRAHADFPSPELLAALKARLLEPPDCLPACAQIPIMQADVGARTITLSLQAHADKAVAVPLPADAEQWFPNAVTLDGRPAPGLLRAGNALWLGLDAGTHDIVMTGAVPALSKFVVPLPLKPRLLTVKTEGWRVKGQHEDGAAEDMLQFVLTAGDDAAGKTAAEAAPPFVRVERFLQLGLDWRVTTRIIRLTAADAALALSVPLLPGESVTTEGVRASEGRADIYLAAGQTQAQWQSALAKADRLELQAMPTSQWTETWRLDVSPAWHVEAAGFPMIYIDGNARQFPEWRPWPGEKLTLTITRPRPVSGSTLTVDSTNMQLRLGQRSRDVELKVALRSSQAGQHSIRLPDNAVLQSVAVDGQAQPMRLEGASLTLPVRPGRQEWLIRWQSPAGAGPVVKTPLVDLGSPGVNAGLQAEIGQDRWLLFAWGPRLGPAVLFWGEVGVSALLAFALGRVRLTPLKGRHWFLLFLGLSQLPPESAAVVVIWLLALGWRAALTVRPRYFNFIQIVIGLLTILALAELGFAVAQGLLAYPTMGVDGNGSQAYSLRWYQDRSGSVLPTATVVSAPMTIYRILMLVWSLWLAAALLGWLKWGWKGFISGGVRHKKTPSVRETPAPLGESSENK